jgi:hypothetical protein
VDTEGYGNVVPRRSSQPLKVDEIHSAMEVKKRTILFGLIKRRLGTLSNPPKQKNAEDLDNNKLEEYEEDDEPEQT